MTGGGGGSTSCGAGPEIPLAKERPHSPERPGEYPRELVLRVNEVFHDVERDGYDTKHARTLRDEAGRWQGLAAELLGGERAAVSVLDVGSGTGFVPLQLGPRLREGDRLVCSDLSAGMLETCEKNLRDAGLACRIEFVKSSGGGRGGGSGGGKPAGLDLSAESFDLVTMNSVLHHIPEPGEFLAGLGRLVRPGGAGGAIVICHEPNRDFYASRLTRWNHRLCFYLFQPKEAVVKVLRALRIYGPARRLYRWALGRTDAADPILDEVNRRLIEAGAIREPLDPDELTAITDIHSPISGGWHPERGIDIRRLVREYMPGYEIERFETSNHLGELVPRFFLSRWYEAVVARLAPSRGATFMAVLRGPSVP